MVESVEPIVLLMSVQQLLTVPNWLLALTLLMVLSVSVHLASLVMARSVETTVQVSSSKDLKFLRL